MPSRSDPAHARVTQVWLTLGLLLALLAGLLVLHGARSWQLAQRQARAEAEAEATVAAAQIASALQHLEDIVLHTRFTFEEFGPGLLERDPVARSREGMQPPHRFVTVINAAGDPALVLPPGEALPALGSLARRLATDRGQQVHVEPLVLPDGRWSLLMAQRLVYGDQTYAGAAVAALDPAVLDRALAPFFPDPLLQARLRQRQSPAVALAVPADADPAAATERRAVAEVAVPAAGDLVLQVDADERALRATWRQQMAAPLLGALGVAAVIVALGIALLRGLRREVASELRAQSAAAEAQVRTRFLAQMSHEIRTPMNGVLGAVELLAAQPLSTDQRRLVEVVRSSGESLLTLLNDLLDASKLEAGRLQLLCEPFELAEPVEDVVVLLAPLAQSRGVRVWHVIDHTLPPMISGDALRLRQVMTNLMSNAIKFTLRGHVVLRCDASAGSEGEPGWRISLEDSGIGIPPEDLPRLFTPFAQLHTGGAARFGGTGLGLSIADNLVRLMKGRIDVASTPFEGSRFSVWLPLSAPAQPGDASQELHPPRPVLVLVADPAGQEAMREHLAWAGWQPEIATSLQDALTLAQRLQSVQTEPLPWVVDAATLPWPIGEAAGFLRTIEGWQARWPALLLSDTPAPQAGTETIVCHHQPMRRRELADTLRSLTQPAKRAEQPASKLQAPPPAEHRGIRVLAAEDNPVNRMILSEMLGHLGCVPDLVDDGAAALQALTQRSYDLVLMDCQMPGMDGFEATRRWRDIERAREGAPHTPVVALTAFAMPDDRQRCLDAGMDDHLGKPYALDDLAAVLQRWVRRPATTA